MRRLRYLLATALLTAAGATPWVAQAQSFSANYDLTRPVAVSYGDTDLMPGARGIGFGQVRLAPAFGIGSGAGLSLEAGEAWFGRLTVGRTVETDMLAIGGGYRFRDGQAVSMQFTRGTQDRLGLAVRYDWPRYYVRVGIDREGSMPDILRFSAGMRF